MALAYITSVTAYRSLFEQKVKTIAANLGIQPDWLMTVMWAESKLDHLAQNPNSTAFGLIQFLASTLYELGTTAEALKGKTNVQQLDYVEKYFVKKGLKGKMKSVYDVYLGVFSPAYVGKPDSTVMYANGSSAYQNNRALDVDGDGKITVGNVKTWFGKYVLPGTPTTSQDNTLLYLALAGVAILVIGFLNDNQNTSKDE